MGNMWILFVPYKASTSQHFSKPTQRRISWVKGQLMLVPPLSCGGVLRKHPLIMKLYNQDQINDAPIKENVDHQSRKMLTVNQAN